MSASPTSDEAWEQAWAELRGSLRRQPRCAEHPEFRCIRTLADHSVNDILSVEERRIRVRSHRTGNEDEIPAASFRAWWVHLEENGTAALDPNDPNCPRSDRARLVGAILVRCLPNRIEQDGRQIRLISGSVVRDCPLPQEVPPDAPIVEGASRTIIVDAYERDPAARRKCIAAHGAACCVCGFDFGAVYGPMADGFIEVHHLRPLSEVREAHVVNPVDDLRPVCPNCHAVLHRRRPAFTIEDVQTFLRRQKEP